MKINFWGFLAIIIVSFAILYTIRLWILKDAIEKEAEAFRLQQENNNQNKITV